jgi:hypothetical protein
VVTGSSILLPTTTISFLTDLLFTSSIFDIPVEDPPQQHAYDPLGIAISINYISHWSIDADSSEHNCRLSTSPKIRWKGFQTISATLDCPRYRIPFCVDITVA